MGSFLRNVFSSSAMMLLKLGAQDVHYGCAMFRPAHVSVEAEDIVFQDVVQKDLVLGTGKRILIVLLDVTHASPYALVL